MEGKVWQHAGLKQKHAMSVQLSVWVVGLLKVYGYEALGFIGFGGQGSYIRSRIMCFGVLARLMKLKFGRILWS